MIWGEQRGNEGQVTTIRHFGIRCMKYSHYNKMLVLIMSHFPLILCKELHALHREPTNLCNWGKRSRKKNSGLQRDSNPWPPRIPVRCSYQPSYEATHWEPGHFFPNCINWWAHGEDRAIACFSPPCKIISFILSILCKPTIFKSSRIQWIKGSNRYSKVTCGYCCCCCCWWWWWWWWW